MWDSGLETSLPAAHLPDQGQATKLSPVQVQACINYVLDVLLGEADRESVSEEIWYGDAQAGLESDKRLVIEASPFFSRWYGDGHRIPVPPLPNIEGTPLLFGHPVVARSGQKILVKADIIASTYFLTTRYEESVRKRIRDENGRFPGIRSLAVRAGFIHRPVVDEYACLLTKWLKAAGIGVPLARRQFSVSLTHDVDSLRRYKGIVPYLKKCANALIGRMPLQEILEGARTLSGSVKDPFDNFEEMAALDAAFLTGRTNAAVKVIYYIMACDADEAASHYHLGDPEATQLVRFLKEETDAGFGLHTSYKAGIHPERIAVEKERLEEALDMPVRLNRHHYLAWREPEHGVYLDKAGITCDSTLGYADVAGFRLGVCRRIPLFDPVRIERLRVWEQPLTLMEDTLGSAKYMGLDEEAAFEYARGLLNQCRRHQGDLVLLWHNTSLSTACSQYYPRLYHRLLKELAG